MIVMFCQHGWCAVLKSDMLKQLAAVGSELKEAEKELKMLTYRLRQCKIWELLTLPSEHDIIHHKK